MTLRRALWASPLAVSVAVLAHLVAFGSLHAPGAEHAPLLLAILAVTLTAGLTGAFAGGVSGRVPTHIATEPPSRYAPLFLAAAGALAFGLLELSEGHFALRALFEAALTSLPLAYAVSFAARCARSAARSAGIRCAAYVSRAARDIWPVSIFRGSTRVLVAVPVRSYSAQRGRAPPSSI